MPNTFIPFHVPAIGEEEIDAVVKTMRSGWLTTGPKARQFEDEFSRFLGCSHAVAVNSGTAALHLALDAVGIKEGDEVIVPTMTFAATAEVVVYFKAKPVLVDCQPKTLNIDPDQIERAVGPRTKAIISVDFGGQPCDYDRIKAIAGRNKLKLIEDAAHALPASYKGTAVGKVADITCFSFYATKTITTGEGGMATTENPEWADRMRCMSLHGISKDAWNRYSAEGSWYYEIIYPGFKYNLTDIAAALGIEQLKKCNAMWEARRRIASLYDIGLADIPEIRRPACGSELQHAWHLYVIQLDLDRLRIGRNQFMEELKQQGIGASVHFIPLHLHPYYRDTFGYKPDDFPVASDVFKRIISLPIYPSMTDRDTESVLSGIRKIVDQFRR